MPDYDANERHRWSYMTSQQLATRLSRIINVEKLDAFIRMSISQNAHNLTWLAHDRYRVLCGALHYTEHDDRHTDEIVEERELFNRTWNPPSSERSNGRFVNEIPLNRTMDLAKGTVTLGNSTETEEEWKERMKLEEKKAKRANVRMIRIGGRK